LGEFPLVRAAFEAGELSYSKARAITRVLTPETEEDPHLAQQASAVQVERVVRGYRRCLAATSEAADDAYGAPLRRLPVG